MYIDYFDKFYNMEPYLEINEKEWEYITETFDKEDVKESLATVAMTYPLPYPGKPSPSTVTTISAPIEIEFLIPVMKAAPTPMLVL